MNILKFLRQEDKFFTWFSEACANNFAAAKQLQKLYKEFKNPQIIAKKIHDLEHKGDNICHTIFDELDASFLTPFDREDLIALTHAIDDVIDLIHKSADDLVNYNIKKVNPIAIQLTDNIVASTHILKDILPKMEKRKTFQQVRRGVYEINRLETEADGLLRNGMRELFRKRTTPVDVIRWLAIYETLEDVTDACEDAGDILNGLIVKYA